MSATTGQGSREEVASPGPASASRSPTIAPPPWIWFVASGVGGAAIEVALGRALTTAHEVLLASPQVSIDRPAGTLDLALFYGGTAAFATAAAWLVLHRARGSSRPPALRARVIALGVWTLILSGGLVAGPAMLVPRVGPRTVISGSALDPAWHHYLFVAPLASADCWLQRPIPLVVSEDGRWLAQGYFQGRRGDVHLVLAAASPTPLHPAPLDRPGRYDCANLLRGVRRFARVVTIR